MNPSFRAQEPQMQASLKHKRQIGGLRVSIIRDKDEELALFLDMRKREKERDDLLLDSSDEFDASLGTKYGTSPIFNISPLPAPAHKIGPDELLDCENYKNDYDWLLTPPGTPLFPSLEMESQKTLISQLVSPESRPTLLISRLANPLPEQTARNNLSSKQPVLDSSSAGTHKLSSSFGPGSRRSISTGRPSLTTASKSSRSSTPTSRTSIPSSKSILPSTNSSFSATKSSVASPKPSAAARSSSPNPRSTVRSSTPTSRHAVPPPKPTSRASTPTRRSTTPLRAPLVSKLPSTSSRNAVPSRGSSPTVKSRPLKTSEMHRVSPEAPTIIKTSLPRRPVSATRGRPGPPNSRSSSMERISDGRARKQSCSPSRGRIPNGIIHPSGTSVPARNRGNSKVGENLSPVLMGTKMVERVVNMRKLAPPKQYEKPSPNINNMSGKSSSSPDSLGFGRTLSNKSLDMAIRHMDIRRSMPGNIRPLMTNIPASSMNIVRSGSIRGRTVSISDSPLSTSSNASSEVSALCLDAIEVGDEINSERGG